MVGHSHLHARQHHHAEQRDNNPFEGIFDGFNDLTSAAGQFFGVGGNPSKPTPPPAQAAPQPTTAAAPAVAPAPVPAAPSPAAPAQANPVTQDTPTQANGNGNSGSGNSGNSNNNNGNGNANSNNKGAGAASPSIVYVTQAWTGTGEYSLSTQTPDPTPEKTQAPAPDPTPTTTTKPSTRRTTLKTSQSSPAAAATTAAAAATTSAISSIAALSSSDDSSTAPAAAATTGPASLASDSSSSGGPSGGAKAGIAIGVILAILALAAGAYALYRMKKAKDEEAYERAASSEKNPFSDAAVAQAPPPMISAPSGFSHNPAAAASTNPFGSGAVSVPPVSAPMAAPAMAPTNVSNSTMLGVGAAALAGGAAVGAAAATTKGRRNNLPEPINTNRAQSPALIPPPPIAASPSGSNFSESSTLTNGAMAAVGGAGAGAANGPRMHRVQMDFNPTMEDEVQITAGEVVRIAKEFDDGWCSVEIIQRDAQGMILRHQAGVVPRTCLSRLPLKPRQKRPGPPANVPTVAKMNGSVNQHGPPNANRSQSAALAPSAVQRSMSPGPYGGGPQDRPQDPEARARSNSADMGVRPKTAPLGPSPMNPGAAAAQGSDSTPMHARVGSGESTSSAPVARKPVPKNTEV